MTSDSQSSSDAAPPGGGRFATTHWSLVAAAVDHASVDARAALESLCQSYWYPLYVFVRRQGHDADESRDLTQGFFLELLSKDRLDRAAAERGRFRSFLLASLRNYLANQRRNERAEKRGGGRAILSLDFSTGEARYRQEPEDRASPERIFERRWAITVTQAALAALEADYAADGKRDLFLALAPWLNGDGDGNYAELGAKLGLSGGAVKTAVHRLRARCRDCVRREIARTVSDEAEIEDEMGQLFAALGE